MTTLESPVVIGGLGGSGTRLFAAFLEELNFQVGEDRNSALDNREFTFLFKRRDWLLRELKNGGEGIETGLSILKKAITGEEHFTFSEFGFLATAAFALSRKRHSGRRPWDQWLWNVHRLKNILSQRKLQTGNSPGWAWKEPNSHVILPKIHKRFPSVRYIHVIRHGLDMAFSRNQLQLQNWGGLFGISEPREPQPAQKIAVEFWIRANRRALDYGRTMSPGQFLLLNYDEFCSAPETGLQTLLQFLGIVVKDDLKAKLLRHCQPSSIGRHSQHDLSIFDESQLQAVEQFGFAIEPAEPRAA